MKFTSPVYSAVSGSIAGITYARNAGGMYARARAVPTNPDTAQQQAVRSAFAGAAAAWALDLTDGEQEGWRTYAANVPVINSLGASTHRSGQNWFGGSATLRAQAGLDVVYTAPGSFTRPTLTAPTFNLAAAATTVSMVFENADEWANQDGGALLVYASRPQNPGRVFFKGPYRFAGVVVGDATTPPTSPAVITLPWASASAGTKMFFKVVAVTEDGRYSDGTFLTSIA